MIVIFRCTFAVKRLVAHTRVKIDNFIEIQSK